MPRKKHCPKCDDDKFLTDFHVRRASPDGRSTYCKECQRTAMKGAYRKNPEASKAAVTRWRAANREKYLETKRRYNKQNRRRQYIKATFGISLEEYDALVNKPICDICKRPLKKRRKKTTASTRCLDHCHKSKRIRGVLCHGCNVGLGCFGDDPALLRAAAAYLERC